MIPNCIIYISKQGTEIEYHFTPNEMETQHRLIKSECDKFL